MAKPDQNGRNRPILTLPRNRERRGKVVPLRPDDYVELTPEQEKYFDECGPDGAHEKRRHDRRV